jgi:hypothetical protein
VGVFAILRARDKGDRSAGFEVEQCHVNLWALGGFGTTFYFDVGLRLKASSGPLESFDLILPVRPVADWWQPLDKTLGDARNLALIFGKEVKSTGAVAQHTLTLDYDAPKRPAVLVHAIDTISDVVSSAGQAGGGGKRQFTVKTVTLSQAITAGKEGYVRFRLEAAATGRLWAWTRSLGLKTGALIDFRVADVREVLVDSQSGSLISRVVDIKELFVFVVAYANLRHHASSPPLHYIRPLEGVDWESYLDRRIGFRPHAKMLIYEWRSRMNDPAGVGGAVRAAVSPIRPFRGYIELVRRNGPNAVATFLIGSVSNLVLLIAVYYFSPGLPTPAAIGSWWGNVWAKLVTALTTLGVISFLLRFVPILHGWTVKFRNFLRRVARGIMAARVTRT